MVSVERLFLDVSCISVWVTLFEYRMFLGVKREFAVEATGSVTALIRMNREGILL